MISSRQTVRYLQRRFEEVGIRPVAKRGQNFLIDLNLLDVLIREADLRKGDVVLEVGTGTGSLTAQLADRAAAVVTVEIDRQLQQLASEELFPRDNIILLQQDVLRNKNNVHANVLDAVQHQMTTRGASGYKLVANLPFAVATPLVCNLLQGTLVPTSMTITIQKELADRITAMPRTKDYGALSVWVQSLCDTRVLRILPPSAFWPRPKVSSAIIQVVPCEQKRVQFPDLNFYHQFVRALFFHRRKFLRGVLVAAMKGRLDKPQVDEVLTALRLGSDCRAEQLDIAAIGELCEAFRVKLPA